MDFELDEKENAWADLEDKGGAALLSGEEMELIFSQTMVPGINDETVLEIEDELLPLVNISAAAHAGQINRLEFDEAQLVPQDDVWAAADAEQSSIAGAVLMSETRNEEMGLISQHTMVPGITDGAALLSDEDMGLIFPQTMVPGINDGAALLSDEDMGLIFPQTMVPGINDERVLQLEEELRPLIAISAAAHAGERAVLPETRTQEMATPSMTHSSPQPSHKLVPFATLISAIQKKVGEGKAKQIQTLLIQYKATSISRDRLLKSLRTIVGERNLELIMNEVKSEAAWKARAPAARIQLQSSPRQVQGSSSAVALPESSQTARHESHPQVQTQLDNNKVVFEKLYDRIQKNEITKWGFVEEVRYIAGKMVMEMGPSEKQT